MQTFLFYDIETSGLNPAFDQVLTFASIRTDLNLNEIDREAITIQLRRDIVPSPKAFLTHGLSLEELSAGLCEYEAAKRIHQLVNTPNTISIGYNSLGFDDEFLRFLFYRNLLDPYSHQYGQGCSRMDILPVAVIYKVFHPRNVKWPKVDGKSSLKLELISKENKFLTTGRAHEAMSDVESLIGLSKLLIKEKEIWRYCLDFFNKTRDEVRISSIETVCDALPGKNILCLMASPAFGPEANYLAPVILIGPSTAYKNQNLWLRLDSDDILGLEADGGLETTFVIRKRYGDTPIVLPAIERFWNRLSEPVKALAGRNVETLRDNPQRFDEFVAYHRGYEYPFVPNIDPDAALYQAGFFSTREKKESRMFHQAGADEKSTILEQLKSDRVRQLARRILMRNFNMAEGNDLNAVFGRHEEDQIVGYKNDVKFNRQMGMDELSDLNQTLENPDPEQKKMLEWLASYIQENF